MEENENKKLNTEDLRLLVVVVLLAVFVTAGIINLMTGGAVSIRPFGALQYYLK